MYVNIKEIIKNKSAMHAMEIFNYGCSISGHHTYVPNIYDDMLRTGKRIFAVAADDNHNKYSQDNPKFDSFGGFTMIKADELTYSSVMDALFKGNFYASQGPEIYSLYIENNKIHIHCSDSKMIVLSTNRRSPQSVLAPKCESINKAEFTLDREDVYIRITIKDAVGKYANTNAYFTECF